MHCSSLPSPLAPIGKFSWKGTAAAYRKEKAVPGEQTASSAHCRRVMDKAGGVGCRHGCPLSHGTVLTLHQLMIAVGPVLRCWNGEKKNQPCIFLCHFQAHTQRERSAMFESLKEGSAP